LAPNDYVREKTVSYLNREFNAIKRDLLRFLQAHHSGSFTDQNETSPGMAVVDAIAYVGDMLSLYTDNAFNELRHDRARQLENVVSFAKAKGYRPKGKAAANGTQYFMIEVPAALDSSGIMVPDSRYVPVLEKGARVGGPNGTTFETLDAIDFADSTGLAVTGSQFNATTGAPTHFALRKSVPIVAGKTVTETFTLGEFRKFRKLELTNTDVLEILSVTDSDGNEWHEVEYLVQDWVFDEVVNEGDDSDSVPYILKMVTAPRRFINDFDPVTTKATLIFGSGDGISFDDELIPNVADMALPLAGRRTFTAFAIDPRNFTKSKSLGLCPYNTTLTVSYRVGGGAETNVSDRSIRSVLSANMTFPSTDVDVNVKGAVEQSIGTVNLDPTDGGGPAETITEIKLNSAAYFAAQARVVTREDAIARIYSLPTKFGRVEKAYPRRNSTSGYSVDIRVLTRDANMHLAKASRTLKQNIATYLGPYRMLTDGINIFDGEIVNIGVKFGVIVSSKYNKTEVLVSCVETIRDYMDTSSMQLEQPIIISDLSAEIQNIGGVVSVYDLSFVSKVGDDSGFIYSDIAFAPDAHIRDGILYPPENSIFEIKYPNRDIVGVAK
jgi:hypothetical protein